MSGIAAFIAGLGTGYVQGTKYQDEQARLKKKDQMEQETHDAQMSAAADASTERKQKLTNEAALRNAAAPATVDQGANGVTKPDTADNIDVGQPGEPGADSGGLVPGALVNGQATGDPGAAAAAYNAPGARQARMIGAMEGTGDYKGAADLKASGLKTQAAQQALADSVWKHDLGAAMQGGHDGLAQLVSQSQSGAMAGKTLKAVPSPDGKTVNYNVVGDDGTLTPTNLTFTNDPAGVAQAGYMLDKTVTPDHRVDYAIKSAKTAAEVKELNAKAGYWDANGVKQGVLAANGGGAGKKADHFDEKEWNNAAKIDKGVVSLPNAFGDKDVESGDLRSAYLQVFNAAKTSGDFAPNEAVEHATTTVVRLKNAAQARVDAAKAADPKSPLTIDQAVRQIVKESAARQAATPKPSTAPGAAGPVNTVIAPNGHPTVSTSSQADMDAQSGTMMIKSDFAGDVNKAVAALPELQAELGRTKNADAKGILQGYMNRLQAGIAASKTAPAPVAAPAVPAAPRPAAQGIPAVAPVAAPAAPVAASVGVPPPDPGVALDTARAALAAAKANASKPKKTIADYDAANRAVDAARQAVDQAEAAYAKAVGPIRPSFTAARM